MDLQNLVTSLINSDEAVRVVMFVREWWWMFFLAWWPVFGLVAYLKKSGGWFAIPIIITILSLVSVSWNLSAADAYANGDYRTWECSGPRDDFCLDDLSVLDPAMVRNDHGDLDHLATGVNLLGDQMVWNMGATLFFATVGLIMVIIVAALYLLFFLLGLIFPGLRAKTAPPTE